MKKDLTRVKMFCKYQDVSKVINFLIENDCYQSPIEKYSSNRYDWLKESINGKDFYVAIHDSKKTDWWHYEDEISLGFYTEYCSDYQYINFEELFFRDFEDDDMEINI